jgi:hypothetical protein
MNENLVIPPRPVDGFVHVYAPSGGHELSVACWCMPVVVEMPGRTMVIHQQYAASVKPPQRES